MPQRTDPTSTSLIVNLKHIYRRISNLMALSPSASTSQSVTCLVDGCAADLSDCRKYYKRHKVCEIHSKSPQVSIHGQNLRFCQQCSRFHSLEEFDEGKRSCRKRLDGHNRRRRKPQPYVNQGTSMLQPGGQQVQVHRTMALTNPLWSGVVEAPGWVDHSNYAPSLLSFSVAQPQASVSTVGNVVQSTSDSGSVSIKAGSSDQGPSYGGMGNDCVVGWGCMTAIDPHDHASFDDEDLQTLPPYWQS
ncbi:hypothetical protein QVD17_10851 [Tagetes erecta]|uniref:SBP-type domain-containing protein n=1 Tax=Tagetes erecta TaxID=13708 RepID=A0AAD8L3N6_TARER|nr:hypothetical protein QVD17_10851 [Tagetes erecta]